MKQVMQKLKNSDDFLNSIDSYKSINIRIGDGFVEAQKTTISNLQNYLRTRRLTASHGTLESTHQKIRIYLAETLLKIVSEKLTGYRDYHQQYLVLLAHYQLGDPMFFMDDDFEHMVRKPIEKKIDKFQRNDSQSIIPM